MAHGGLDFEKPILDIERRINELKSFISSENLNLTPELKKLEARLERLKEETYSNLTPWQRTQIARHSLRPTSSEFIESILDDEFTELHGDRCFGDDRAIIGGLGVLEGEPIVVIGHQKGKNTKENLKRNFGMSHPEGNRKALRLMKLAEKFRLPILSLVDTPGAYPGTEAEERGQAMVIAQNLREMAGIRTPIVVAITGEGMSGGALAIGVGDRIIMLENAIFSVIGPEACAAILWGNRTRAPQAAESLKMTSHDLLELGVVEEVIPEPPGGAHRDPRKVARDLKVKIVELLAELKTLSPDELLEQRYMKYRRIGEFSGG